MPLLVDFDCIYPKRPERLVQGIRGPLMGLLIIRTVDFLKFIVNINGAKIDIDRIAVVMLSRYICVEKLKFGRLSRNSFLTVQPYFEIYQLISN